MTQRTQCGTPGYAAPEFMNGYISEAADVYSLGALILTTLTDQKALENGDHVSDTIADQLSAGDNISFVANHLRAEWGANSEALNCVIEVAISCCKRKSKRSTLNDVLDALDFLERNLQVLAPAV